MEDRFVQGRGEPLPILEYFCLHFLCFLFNFLLICIWSGLNSDDDEEDEPSALGCFVGLGFGDPGLVAVWECDRFPVTCSGSIVTGFRERVSALVLYLPGLYIRLVLFSSA